MTDQAPLDPGAIEVPDALIQLSGVLLNEAATDSLLELLVVLARRTVAKADGVGVTLKENGSFKTASSSDQEVDEVDRIQYYLHEGPCVSSLESGVAITTPDVRTDDRWPNFAAGAAEHGIAAMHSEPLTVRGESVGALNVYSLASGAFDERSIKTLALYAKQASIVLNNAQAFYSAEDANRNLKEALATRDIIGTAKGILIERESVTSAEAFEMLTRLSQHSNTKLRDVAAEVVRMTENSAT